MAILESAQTFFAWAATHGLVADAWEGLASAGGVDAHLAGVSQEAIAVLRKRQIRHVGFSDTPETITVYLKKAAPTAKELAALPNQVLGFPVTYRQGNPDSIGATPPQPYTATAFYSHASVATGSTHYACGSSISLGNEVSAGTLGALVRDVDGVLYGLSNNHVVGGSGQAPMGLPVVAPGLVDVTPHNIDPVTLGRLAKAEPMLSGDPTRVNHHQNLDCALFSVKDPTSLSSMQGGLYDTPAAHALPTHGMLVEKVGRTTGHTRGMVVNQLVGPFSVPVSNSTYGFSGRVFFEPIYVVQGLTERFSEPGDSGSLIVGVNATTGERTAVGLLFAGMQDSNAPGGGLTLMLPLSPILDRLGVELVSAHNV